MAIVNEAMVEQYRRGADPVGQRPQVKGKWMQVVGVARAFCVPTSAAGIRVPSGLATGH